MSYCPICGSELREDVEFCSNCGAKIIKEQKYQINNQQNLNNHSSTQYPQQYFPIKPKQSYKKIIGVLIVIIISIILIFTSFLLLFTNERDKFIGKWYIESYIADANNINPGTISIFFNGDGSYSLENESESGTWKLEDGKLCIKSIRGTNYTCLKYKFSNNDEKLTLTSSSTIDYETHTFKMVLIKN